MTTTATTALTFADADVDDPAVLCRLLGEIDRLGWDSPPGDLVLDYALDRVVRPAVRRAELGGHRKADAISAGWAAAWEMLNRPDLRDQPRPWGVVAFAIRREIGDEQVSAAYRTNSRRAWRFVRRSRTSSAGEPRPPTQKPATEYADPDADPSRDGLWLAQLDPAAYARPVSLDRLVEDGWDPPSGQTLTESLGPRLSQVVEALVNVGWRRWLAIRCVACLALAAGAAPDRDGVPVELPGWRQLSAGTGLPGWQTRRLAALLLGYRGQPGLIARMIRDGDQVLHTPETQRLMRSTVHRWAPSPCAAASAAPATGASRDAA
jgi:hypothetical protein